MPTGLQVWIVIVTIALLAIAVMTARMAARYISKAAEDISKLTIAATETVEKINDVTKEAEGLVASMREFVPPVQRVISRFENIGNRTADVSSALLQEVERPVFAATAVSRGVRTGAGHFLNRVLHRLTHRHSPNHGDNDHA